MKNHVNLVLLILWLAGTVVSVFASLLGFDVWTFAVPLIPSFCSQLLLCRATKNGWLRALPVLPVLGLLGVAGWYYIFGIGWDKLAALILGLFAIAPAVGIILGWLVWWLIARNKKTSTPEEC